MTGVEVLLGALVVAAALGLLHTWRNGAFRTADRREDLRPLLPGAPGERATLLQFSSAFCAPCRATKRVLADVTGAVPGVTHVEVDAESNLALVRRLDIRRTPTTLVLDADGHETSRATGQPTKQAVLHALAQAVPS